MRLAKITSHFRSYLDDFYRRHPQVRTLDYERQLACMNQDSFSWFDVWSHALAPLGYEVLEVTANAAPQQRQWALEHGLGRRALGDLRTIVVEQIKRFRPDVLWFDHDDASLLEAVKDAVPSLRLVLGWKGSALTNTDAFPHADIILSCAPETVTRLRDAGYRAVHLDHGFDERVLTRISQGGAKHEISFVGQVLRGSQFHKRREEILIALARRNLLTVYSPSQHRAALSLLLKLAVGSTKGLARLGVPEAWIRRFPLGRKLLTNDLDRFSMDPLLRRIVRPGVFGLGAYQVIANSLASLNVHADSSPIHVSNLRLFEITGVGTCMLVDWRSNLASYFSPDTEVISYRSAGDCAEKAEWIVRNPAKAEAIGLAGQRRTLAEHTYAKRAPELDQIIRKALVST